MRIASMLVPAWCAAVPLFAAQPLTPPPFGWPHAGPDTFRMTAAFDLDPTTDIQADWTGWREGEATAGSGHAYDGHSGSDYGMNTNTSLNATANGTVYALRESVPNDDHSDTGNYLIINHTNIGGRDYRTRYWHLAQNGVVPTGTGVAVTKGQKVADSDNTGNSTGPHLHFAMSLLPSDNQTCPFYHAWFENDEFYYGNAYPCLVYLNVNSLANCREGNTTSFPILTTLPANTRLVATQRNTWYRVMLPMPPSFSRESRTAAGGLAAGYVETGTWADNLSKSTPVDDGANRVSLTGSGTRVSTFASSGDAGDSARFSFTAPDQRGIYDIYATWPEDANASRVTYRVTDTNGTTDVLVNQRGRFGSPGTGTKSDPYRITSSPYIADHTTVGAPSQWNSYSPVGTGIAENGPENLYRFDLLTTSSVSVEVEQTGYPDKDVDIHLLTSASNTACVQRADWSFTTAQLQPGTYYISVDSYLDASHATPYRLKVVFAESEMYPAQWNRIGSFFYDRSAAGSVEIRESSVTGSIDSGAPGKMVADAIKIVPRIYRRTGWVSDTLVTRIDTAVTPVTSMVIRTDQTANADSDSIDSFVEVPIHASPSPTTSNSSAIVGKAVTGQRFVCTGSSGDWFRVLLTNGTAATEGWILGDHLIGYHYVPNSEVADWNLY